MVRVCYLCGKRKTKDLRLHRFPKNKNTRQLWLDACNLNHLDDVSNLVICSDHFCLEDYKDTGHVINSRRFLSEIAVPSLKVPYKKEINNPKKHLCTELHHSRENSIGIATVNIAKGMTPNYKIPVKVVLSPSLFVMNKKSLVLLEKSPLPVDSVNREQIVVEHNYSKNQDDELTSTSKERRWAQPRYISEITSSDVATPEKARKIIKFVKIMDAKKTKKIEHLRKKNGYLLKRVAYLQEMVSHLRNKGSSDKRKKNSDCS